MSARLTPAVLAIAIGVLLAVACFVPYVARQYRRRGELGIGNAVLALAGLIYGLGLVAYVLVPFPTVGPDFCAVSGAGGPQLVPFNFLRDMQKEATGSGIAATLRNPALTQVLLNVALFVPLGMFVRYMFRRGVVATAVIGLAVSLLIETTQLTGIWFLYPCAYRLFDVDDLMANGLGALAGALAAPVLRAVPGQRLGAEPGAPRPITRSRRVLAAVCDLLIFKLSGVLVATVGTVLVVAVNGELFDEDGTRIGHLAGQEAAQFVGVWLPWLVLAVVLPLAGSATSLGQRIVRLRVVAGDGSAPGARARLVRSLTGVGGYLLLVQLGDLPVLTTLSLLGSAFAVVSFVALFTTSGFRGLSCRFARLRMVDARTLSAEPAEPAR
ncbi:VanZ family protein [Saccharopolyspora sp. NPDC050642]|uniref:VanZ family protein n=1 Tax=Saccharopolyspora sp. NPDC050642 TaxID=3157099 RepID=UPI00340A79FC